MGGFLRALSEWAAGRAEPAPGSDWRSAMRWHWRCECGAHSRGGDIEADARHNALRHRLSKPAGHPDPEVYEGEVD